MDEISDKVYRKHKKPCVICGEENNTKNYQKKGDYYCQKHYGQMKYYGKIMDRTAHDPNEIHIKENFAVVDLYSNGIKKIAECIIDIEDIEKIKKYKWTKHKKNMVQTHYKNENGETVYLKIHRLIMNAKDGEQVDHINRNRLDNRKCNLRIVTNSQNNMNVPAKKNNKLGYKGVYRSTDNNSWVACLRYEGKLVLNKRFKTLEEALKARKEAEEIYFGEYNYRENNENKN